MSFHSIVGSRQGTANHLQGLRERIPAEGENFFIKSQRTLSSAFVSTLENVRNKICSHIQVVFIWLVISWSSSGHSFKTISPRRAFGL